MLDTDAADAGRARVRRSPSGAATTSSVAAIEALGRHVVGPDVEPLLDGHGRHLAPARSHDSPAALARPGEGRHAHGDRRGRQRRCGTSRPSAPGKPLWQLLAEHDAPSELVDLVDFRYLTDALTPRRGAGDPAQRREPGRAEREAELLGARLPGLHDHRRAGSATTTRSSPGSPARRSRDGFGQIKLKVGGDLDDDVRRLAHRPRGRRARRPHRRRRQPALGRRARRSTGCARSRRSTRAGSRSRPAPTTCSATPRIAQRRRARSGSRPASTWPTG